MQLVASVSVPVVDAGHWIGCSLPCRAPFSRALTCVLYLSLRYKKTAATMRELPLDVCFFNFLLTPICTGIII